MILFLSGKIGSGKTTVANYVVRSKGFISIGFGNYIRKYVREKGLNPKDRNILKKEGEYLVNNEIEFFCRGVLNQVNLQKDEKVIVDGLRHVEVLNTMKRIVKNNAIILIYLDVDDDTRCKRIGLSKKELRKLDLHSTEEQVENKLKERSDILIDAQKEPHLIVDEIFAELTKIGK